MVRTLEWSAISSSCSPRFVRILHCDLSVLGSPTWAGSELHWGTHAPSPQQGCDPWRGCCSMYVVAWKNSFFFMTKQYSLCGDTTFCLFIHQWLGIWNVSTFWIWWVKLLWTFTYYFLCGSSGVALKPWSIYQMLDLLTLDQEGTPADPHSHFLLCGKSAGLFPASLILKCDQVDNSKTKVCYCYDLGP